MSDVRHVMRTMWKRGRKELSALDVDPAGWIVGWHKRIERGDAVAFAEHAILGCDWEGDTTINTSFQASESFELPGVGKQVTKALRAEIPRLMQARRIRLICTYSLCIDPKAPDWFRLLGMTEDDRYVGARFGEYTSRRFIRRA